jgi:hypothetical protein
MASPTSIKAKLRVYISAVIKDAGTDGRAEKAVKPAKATLATWGFESEEMRGAVSIIAKARTASIKKRGALARISSNTAYLVIWGIILKS